MFRPDVTRLVADRLGRPVYLRLAAIGQIDADVVPWDSTLGINPAAVPPENRG